MQVSNKPEISPHLKHPLQRKFTIRAPDGTKKELEAQGRGDCYLARCPFCDNSLSSDFDLRIGTRIYSCYRCGVNGNIIAVGIPEPLIGSLPMASFLVPQLKDEIYRNKKRGFLGIDPGFEFLRKTIQAMIPTHLWIGGGYTSHGKTALAVELMKRVRKTAPNTKITLFSLEMDKISYLLRLVSNVTKIPSLAILRGDHIPEVQERIDSALAEISQWDLIIFDNLYEWSRIQQKAREIKGDVGLDILIVDFVQNVWIRGKGSIYERMSQLAPQIPALAKQLNCTILALSQVSNEAVNEDLRAIAYKGAGELAASCDLGLWLERDRKEDDLLHVAIRKNRHGPVGKTTLRFRDNFTWLCEESEATRGISWTEMDG